MSAQFAFDCFDKSKEKWPTYVRRLQHFFKFAKVKSEDQVSAFITYMGAETYTILENLVDKDALDGKSFTQLITILNAHLDPEPLEISQQVRFIRRKQNEGESPQDFAAALRELSKGCKFGDAQDTFLRVVFVSGLRNERIVQRLIVEANLTFSKALEVAISMDLATRDTAEVLLKPASIHKVSQHTQQKHKKGKSNNVPVQPTANPPSASNSMALCF